MPHGMRYCQAMREPQLSPVRAGCSRGEMTTAQTRRESGCGQGLLWHRRSVVEKLVRQVSKLIVVFGKSDEEWVRKRLEYAAQIAINTPCPLQTLAVCFAPPRRKEDGVQFNWKFLRVHHFNLEEARDPQTLAVLLGK